MGNACSDQSAQKKSPGLKTNVITPECKIVILGDGAVGKTSVALRFIENKFSDAHIVTLGATFQQPKVKLKNGNTVKLNLWDTTGEEKFKSMIPMYYKNAKGVILIYDISSRKSFESVEYWIEELNEHVKAENTVMYLVGNKKDLPPEKREVPSSMAAKIAEEQGIFFLEVSAKSGENVNELFTNIAEELARRFKL